MNILISTKTLALPSVSIYSIVNNDRGNPYFNKRMIWFSTNNFYWWLCQKIHHSKTSNKTKLTYNDEWFVILFCDIKADEDTEHNLLVFFFFHAQALHWTGSSSFMFAPFLTVSPLVLSLRLAAARRLWNVCQYWLYLFNWHCSHWHEDLA